MNKERFNAALAAIQAEPETWEQGSWCPEMTQFMIKNPERFGVFPTCDTACCIAGHVVAQAGVEYARAAYASNNWNDVDPSNRIPDIAQELLGLTEDEAEWLFDSERSLSEFVKVRELGSVTLAMLHFEDEAQDGYDGEESDPDCEE